MHRLNENRTIITKLPQVTGETIEMKLIFFGDKKLETLTYKQLKHQTD